ncbi:RsmB/NOP family class I SAM-dependent RNA methyltransferase [Maritalea myrionectae]|uniref:16S rRNA (Cytosine(967)-C(5))-methyltransferase n=1 Tax=Maritalea myrionectae TaxID=454601 RepID=A0A2R4MA98_9HYPH|nr:RsmB/NOP family class I SAM-dependent RNA methyltransferase [Maritalea myrionectae]AVX02967.1 16S rRNA (cytosine(967)-C(5))-methyltransferase [Maritalea myrionectae]
MSAKSNTAGLDVRRAAAQRLQLVLTGAPFIPFGADDFEDGRERALANRLVTTALRRHGQINQVLVSVLDKGMPKRAGLFEPAMRIGIAQLLFMPEQGAHAALHLAVETIKRDRRASRFAKLANAALRSVQRQADDWPLRVQDLVPEWMFKRWTKQYGETQAHKMAELLLAQPPLDLVFKSGVEPQTGANGFDGLAALLPQSFRLATRDASVADLPDYADGQWWVQDLSSTLPARLAGSLVGKKVLDLCAAPGGKTAQLCDMGGLVTAVEIEPDRLSRLKENLERLNFHAEMLEADATQLDGLDEFDVVMLDAPCSATGTFRRHPEVLWHRKESDFAHRAALQSEMLGSAAKKVAKGGQLIYCTCSLEPEEGENQIEQFLKQHSEFALAPIKSDELAGWAGPIDLNGYVRALPCVELPNGCTGGTDGFFAARLQRVA